MSLSTQKQITRAYRHTCTSDSPPEAYRDFVDLLDVLRPNVKQLLATVDSKNIRSAAARSAIGGVLQAQVYLPEAGDTPVQRFRGSGFVVVGNSEGTIIAACYQKKAIDAAADEYGGPETEPVADYYGSYQVAGMRKLALAALVGRRRFDGYLDPADEYAHTQITLETVGKGGEAGASHHLGYAVARIPNGFLTAAACGIRPSTAVRVHMENSPNAQRMDVFRDLGSEAQEGDEGAGIHDAAVAIGVLNQLVPQLTPKLSATTWGYDANLN